MSTDGFVPIGDVIDCLLREISRRKGAYPQLILSGKLHRRTATRELSNMEAALEIVRGVRNADMKEIRE